MAKSEKPVKPLPSAEEISEKFRCQILRFVAGCKPDFYADTARKFYMYPSEFLGSLRLGRYREEYDKILKIIKQSKFPLADTFTISLEIEDPRNVPDVRIMLTGDAEWGEVLNELPLIEGIGPYWNLRRGSGPWLFGFSLRKGSSWDSVRAAINQRCTVLDCATLYGLTPEAGLLLDWLRFEPLDRFALSPPIEPALRLGIGIDLKKIGEKNFAPLMRLLCDEITRKTEWEATVWPWVDNYREVTRIRLLKS